MTVVHVTDTADILHPDVETLTQQELRQRIDLPLLHKQIDHVVKNSRFYQNKFGKEKSAQRLVENFSQLPFTEKSEVVADQIAVPPFGSLLSVKQEQINRIHRTSGTTGRPVFLPLTRNDIQATVASGARGFWASGLRPGDTVFHCLNYCMWMGGVMDHLSLEATGATVVPFGVGNSKTLIECIQYIKPTALHCTISYLSRLELLLQEEFQMTPGDLGLRKGFFAGEGGIQNPVNRSRIESVWGLKAMDANYGISDVLSLFGSECSLQAGMHFMGQGNLLVELINPESTAVLPIEKGVVGEFVLTTLNKEAFPLVRFRSHDMVEILDHNQCRCGRASFRFKVLGRSDEMIVVKGINLFPSALGDIVCTFPELTGEYQVIIPNKDVIEGLRLLVECKEFQLDVASAKALRDDIQKIIKEKFSVTANVELLEKGKFPRTEGKTKRLIRE